MSASFLNDCSHVTNFDEHVGFDLTSPQSSHIPFTSLDHAPVSHDSVESLEEMPQLLDSDVVGPNLNSVHGVDRPFASHFPLPAFFRCLRPTSSSDDIPSVVK